MEPLYTVRFKSQSYGKHQLFSDTIKNIYTIRLKANIEKNWHLYSQFSDPNGAIPTEFKFKKNKKYRLIGRVNETESTVAYDEVFEMDLSYFTEKAIFTQKIEIFDTNLNKIEAEVNYQACDDKLYFQKRKFLHYLLMVQIFSITKL